MLCWRYSRDAVVSKHGLCGMRWFVVFCLAWCGFCGGSPAWANSPSVKEFHFRDFSKLDTLVLSGHTAEIAKDPARQHALRLTNELGQHGGAFFHQRISLANRASFSTAFSFRLHHPMGDTDLSDNVQGADGFVFVIQTQNNQVGGMGVGIGYGEIKDSIGIEFDTWFNDGLDPDGNHVGINVDGELKSVKTKSMKPSFNNGAVWYAWVDYHGPTQRLEVRVSQTKQRPVAPTLAHNLDLVAILKRPDVYVGFTAGTGSSGNYHDILDWQFRGYFDPVDSSPNGGLMVTEKEIHTVTPDQIGIILDASCSMLARVAKKERRIDLAKRILREIAPSMPSQSQVGLLVYGHRWPSRLRAKSCQDTEMIVPFAPFAKDKFFAALHKIRPRGETPIGRALAKMGRNLLASSSPKWLVVLSDGMETCDPQPHHPYYPGRVIRELQRKGIQVRLNIVGLGITRANTHRFLRQIAAQTGGHYFDTKRADELKQALASALAVRFDVRDTTKKIVATGQVGSPSPVSLPPGRYTLDVLSHPPVLHHPIEIRNKRTTRLAISRTQGPSYQLVDESAPKTTAPAPPTSPNKQIATAPAPPTSPNKQITSTPQAPLTSPPMTTATAVKSVAVVKTAEPTTTGTTTKPVVVAKPAEPAATPPVKRTEPATTAALVKPGSSATTGSSLQSASPHLFVGGALTQDKGIWTYRADLPTSTDRKSVV